LKRSLEKSNNKKDRLKKQMKNMLEIKCYVPGLNIRVDTAKEKIKKLEDLRKLIRMKPREIRQ
jgi:CTP-dependent riboflavin kinase